MAQVESLAASPVGHYRDLLRDAQGRVTWDSGWRPNAIVPTCRRLLAAFTFGFANTDGIVGLWIGEGLPIWDTAGTPPASSTQPHLEDPDPFLVPPANLKLRFLDSTGAVSLAPTERVEAQASIGGPGIPPWPDANHPTRDLREFGLVGNLGGTPVLIDYITHPVIVMDPTSTLERTIWLQF